MAFAYILPTSPTSVISLGLTPLKPFSIEVFIRLDDLSGCIRSRHAGNISVVIQKPLSAMGSALLVH